MQLIQIGEHGQALSTYHHVALGFFDGLHLGHRSVILNPFSQEAPEKTAIVSFWPHPLTVLRPEQAPPLLTDREEKNEILERWQLGAHCIIPFDEKTACHPPEWLLTRLSENFPDLESLSVGPNFRFGQKRSGSPLTLSHWCEDKQIDFHLTDFVLDHGMPISSSRIRQSLAAGELKIANRLLGHHYQLGGKVVEGQRQGRLLGFPTANLAMKKNNILPLGVYAALAEISDGEKIPCALNIGHRPTMQNRDPSLSVEAHLINWEGDCYGQRIRITPIQHMRPEKHFASRQELTDQIRDDVKNCRQVLLKRSTAE